MPMLVLELTDWSARARLPYRLPDVLPLLGVDEVHVMRYAPVARCADRMPRASALAVPEGVEFVYLLKESVVLVDEEARVPCVDAGREEHGDGDAAFKGESGHGLVRPGSSVGDQLDLRWERADEPLQFSFPNGSVEWREPGTHNANALRNAHHCSSRRMRWYRPVVGGRETPPTAPFYPVLEDCWGMMRWRD